MPYTNIGQLIEPYLRPLGKQTIAQIPQIQAHQLAKERLGANKEVWAEQIIESQQNREIARQAQDRLNQLSGISSEKLQPFIGEGMDPDTAMKLMMADKAKLSSLGPTKPLPPSWQTRTVKDPVTGKLIQETFNANDPNAQLKTEVPMEQVKIGNEWVNMESKGAAAFKQSQMVAATKEEQWEREFKSKAKTERIKHHMEGMTEAKLYGAAGVPLYTYHTQALYDEIGQSTANVPKDPEIDKARAMIFEAMEDLKRYEKASQTPREEGPPLHPDEVQAQAGLDRSKMAMARERENPLAPMEMPQMPPRQFMMPPAKKDKDMTPSQQINQLKLAAWGKYLADPASTSAQEQRLLGVDTDPYVARAAQMVAGDMQKAFLPIDQKVEEVMRIAEIMRAASTTKPKSGEINLPSTIKTTSQAIEYLMSEKKMTKEKAIEWLRSQQ